MHRARWKHSCSGPCPRMLSEGAGPGASAFISSGSRGNTENRRQGPEQARAGWLRAEVGDRSGREAPLEHPCKGTSVCRQQPLSLRLACQCQEYESPQAQPFHFDLHHCQDHNKKSGRIYAPYQFNLY